MLAFIVIAHKNPNQLSRLIKRLSSTRCHIYIHLDIKCDLNEFKTDIINNNGEANWTIFQKFECFWGDNNTVKAIIHSIQKVINTNIKYSHLILLSGQDYPLHSRSHILKFFETSLEKNFIDLKKAEIDDNRLKYYKVQIGPNRNDFHLLPNIFDKSFFTSMNFRKLFNVVKKKNIKILFNLTQSRNLPFESYHGEVWWALNLKTIKLILLFIQENDFFLKFHNSTLSSDEFFFHTILAQIQSENDLKIQNTLTYTNWDKKNETNPKTFNRSDLDELLTAKSKFLFARKFDEFKDIEILNSLDIEA